MSAEFKPGAGSYFQPIIGILGWMTELGRSDIMTKISLCCHSNNIGRKLQRYIINDLSD